MDIVLAALCGFLMDLALGDPAWMPHPVVGMGKCIAALERGLRRAFPKTPRGELAAGAVLAALLPLGTLGLAAGALWLCGLAHPALRFALEAVWCWQALAMRGLRDESRNVCRALTDAQRAARAAAGRAAALRIAVPDETICFTDGHLGPQCQNLARDCGDFVLRRADGVFAYQLAVVVDDGRMGVTEVVRGRDLLASTPRQIYLQRLLGLPQPAYRHIPLLVNPAGQRLSKRERSLDLGALRARYTAPALVGRLAAAAGLAPSGAEAWPRELLNVFSWGNITTSDIIIDESRWA